MPSKISWNSTVTSMEFAAHITSISGAKGESAALAPLTKLTPVSSILLSNDTYGERTFSPPNCKFSSAADNVPLIASSFAADASESWGENDKHQCRP